MYGIPTIQLDYSNNPEIFDPDAFKFDPTAPREKTLYSLRKAIVAAYRKAGVSNKQAEELATRTAEQVLEQLLNPPEEEIKAGVSANATVIKGTPKPPE